MGSQEASIVMCFCITAYESHLPDPFQNIFGTWNRFAKDLDHVIQFISAESGSYDRFTKAVIAAAKRHIPRRYRNQYIPDGTINETSSTKGSILIIMKKNQLCKYP
jgi:hypothetical protein